MLAERKGFAVRFASFLLGRSFLARAAKNVNTVAFSLRLTPSRVQILFHQNKKPAPCANFLFWQRGRDLNPRYDFRRKHDFQLSHLIFIFTPLSSNMPIFRRGIIKSCHFVFICVRLFLYNFGSHVTYL